MPAQNGGWTPLPAPDPDRAVVSASDVNPVTLLAFEKVVMTSAAVKAVEERIK